MYIIKDSVFLCLSVHHNPPLIRYGFFYTLTKLVRISKILLHCRLYNTVLNSRQYTRQYWTAVSIQDSIKQQTVYKTVSDSRQYTRQY